MRKSLVLFLIAICTCAGYQAKAQGWAMEFTVDLETADCYQEDMNSLSCNGYTGTPNSVQLYLGTVTVYGTATSSATSFSISADGTCLNPPPYVGASIGHSRTISIPTDSECNHMNHAPSEAVPPSGSSVLDVYYSFYKRISLSTPTVTDCSINISASCSNGLGYTWEVSKDNVNFVTLSSVTGSNLSLTPAQINSLAGFTDGPYNVTRYFRATGHTGTTSAVVSVTTPFPAPSLNSSLSYGKDPTCPNGEGKLVIVQSSYSAATISKFTYTIDKLITASSCSPATSDFPVSTYPSGYCSGNIYNYQDPSASTSIQLSSANVTGLTAGKGLYLIKVEGTTSGGATTCYVTDTLEIVDPLPVSISNGPTQQAIPSCTGGNDGSVSVTLSDGLSPYTYAVTLVSDGSSVISSTSTSTKTFTTSAKLAYSSSDIYRITVSDICTTIHADFHLPTDGSGPLGLQTSTVASETNAVVTCYDDATTKGDAYWSVNVVAPKPAATSPYTYELYEGSSATGPNVSQTTNKFTQLGKSTYTMKVTAPNNCTNTITKSFTLPSNLNGTFSYGPSCFNENNGTISFTRTAGTTSNMDFTVNGVTKTATRASETWTLSNIAPGSVNVVGYDQCLEPNEGGVTSSKSGSGTIINNSILAFDNAASNIAAGTTYYVSCSTDRFSGSIVYKDGRGPYTATVTKDGVNFSSFTHNTATKTVSFTNLNAGTYILTVKDGCTGNNTITRTFVVDVPTDMTAVISKTDLSCFNDHTGKIQLTVSNGKPGPGSDGSKDYVFKIYNDVTDVEVLATTTDCSPNNENCVVFTGLDAGIPYRFTATDYNPNAAHCTKSFTQAAEIITLTQPAQLTVNAITTANLTNDVVFGGEFYAQCKSDSTISLNASVSGGTSPYQWYLAKQSSSKWPLPKISQASSVFPGLGVGTYKIFVGDKNHCDSTGQLLVIKEAASELLVNNIHRYEYAHGANTSCYGYADGKLDIAVSGGVGNYSYTLTSDNAYSNSITKSGNTHTFTSLPALKASGSNITYTVALQDALGCTWKQQNGLSKTISLDAPDTVEFEWSVVSRTVAGHEIPCNGDSAVVKFSSEGGKFPHTIQIGTDAKTIDTLTTVQYYLYAGTHSPVLTDALGCPALSNDVNLIEPATHVAIHAGIITPPVCIGGTDGQINISATDGVPFSTAGQEYIFLIKKSGAVAFDTDTLRGTGNTFLREANFFTSQNYVVQVRDQFDCSDAVSVTMPQNPSPLTLTDISRISPSCYGGNDGSIQVTASNYSFIGGTSLKFSLSGGHLGNSIYQVTTNSDSYTFTSLEGTDIGSNTPYRAWVEDANACVDTAYQYLDALTLPSFTPVLVDLIAMIRPSCFNGADGSLYLQVSGGVQPYTYSLDNVSFAPVGSGNKIFLSGLQARDYTIYIRDANYKPTQSACFSATTFTVEKGRFISFDADVEHVSCKGGNDGSVDLSIDVDNRAPGENLDPSRLSFFWTNDNVSSLPISSLEDINGLSKGTYTVHANYDVDSLVCMNQTTVNVLEPASAFSISNIKTYNTSCGIHADGTAVVSITGGWADSLTYYRLNSGPWIRFTGSSFILKDLAAADYTIEIAQSHFACIDLKPFTITSASLSISINKTISPTCPMGSDGVVVLESASPGVEYAYEGSSSFQLLSSFTGLAAGTYHFYGRSTAEPTCISEIIPAIITDPADCGDGPLDLILLSKVSSTCDQSSNGQAQVKASGGTPPYAIYWNGTPGTDTRTDLGNNAFLVKVKDALNDEVELTVDITTLENLAAEKFTDLASCATTCDGAATIFPSGGSGAYTITWNDNTTTSLTRTGLCSGNYSYVIMDAQSNLCTTSGDITIDHFPDLSLSQVEAVAPTCPGGTDGHLTVAASGGSGDYGFEWLTTPITSYKLDGVTPGDYTLSLTDNALGCTLQQIFTLPDRQSISVDTVIVTAPLCHQGSDGTAQIVLSNVSSPLVKWSNGQIGLRASGLKPSTVSYTVKGSSGCSIAGTVEIPDREQLTTDVVITSVKCFDSCDGAVQLIPTGGTKPYFVVWSHGPRGINLANLCKGSYAYTITDNNKCSIAGNSDVGGPEQILISSTAVNALCPGSADGSASLTVTGGAGNYTYKWSNGTSSNSLSAAGAGKYTVSVTDENNCHQTKTVTITEPEALLIKNIVLTNPSCLGNNDGQIKFDVTGGTSGYTVAWSDLAIGTPRTNLAAGKYTATVTDAHSCSVVRSFDLTSPVSLEIVNALAVDPHCYGEANGSISLDILGGSKPYTYSWSNGQSVEDLSSKKAGNYTLKVTDKNNCSTAQTFTLVDPEIPQVTGLAETIIICTNSQAAAEPDGDWSSYLWTGPNSFKQETRRFTTTQQGNYKLKVSDLKGCPAEFSFSVQVSANALTADFLRISEAVAFQPIVLVDISIPSPQTIDWVVPDDPNVTVNSMSGGILELIFSEPGTYEIGLKAAMDNCKSELYKIIEVEEPSGRHPDSPSDRDEEQHLDFVLYPNPARDNLDIIVNTGSKAEVSVQLIRVLDSQAIRRESLSGYRDYMLRWELDGAASGIYYLILEQNGKIKSKKLVIVK